MTDIQLCTHDGCEQSAEIGVFCAPHRLETAHALRQVLRDGQKIRGKIAKKSGSLDYLLACARTTDNVADFSRNVVNYNSAFDDCLEHYCRLRYSGTGSAMTQNLDATGSPLPKSTRIVYVRPMDYVSDFDLAAKRVLNPRLQGLLMVLVEGKYAEAKIQRHPELRRRLHSLKQQLGRALISRGIWPTHRYFKPVYL